MHMYTTPTHTHHTFSTTPSVSQFPYQIFLLVVSKGCKPRVGIALGKRPDVAIFGALRNIITDVRTVVGDMKSD